MAYPLLSVNIITTSSCDKEIYVYYNLQFFPQYDCTFSIIETKNKSFQSEKYAWYKGYNMFLYFEKNNCPLLKYVLLNLTVITTYSTQ